MRTAITTAAVLAATTLVLAQTKETRAGITNFTKVDAVVACGGATETTALDGLKADGFKSVVNLRQATEQGANIEENQAKAKALEEAAQSLFAAASAAGQPGGADAGAGPSGGAKSDDVVDAEFTEVKEDKRQ